MKVTNQEIGFFFLETSTLVCPASQLSNKDMVECEYFLKHDWGRNSMWKEYNSYQEVQQDKQNQLNWLKSELEAAADVAKYYFRSNY